MAWRDCDRADAVERHRRAARNGQFKREVAERAHRLAFVERPPTAVQFEILSATCDIAAILGLVEADVDGVAPRFELVIADPAYVDCHERKVALPSDHPRLDLLPRL